MINEVSGDNLDQSTPDTPTYLPPREDNGPKYIRQLELELDDRPEMQAAIADLYNLEVKARQGEVVLDETGQVLEYDGTQALPDQIYELVAKRNRVAAYELRYKYQPMDIGHTPQEDDGTPRFDDSH